MALKLLIAVACIAVIAASGVFLWDRHTERAEAARKAETEAAAALKANAIRCLPVVRAWARGDTAPAVKMFGASAERGVETCRVTLKLEAAMREGG